MSGGGTEWLDGINHIDPFGSRLHVEAVTARIPERDPNRSRKASFLIDATTPHGDVLVNENRAIKPATGWVTLHSVEPIIGGVHEWSIKIENQGETSDGSGLMLGIVPKSFTRYDSFISQGGGWCISRAGKFYGQWKRIEGIGSPSTLVFGTGDTVTFVLDTEASRLTVSVGTRFIVGEISKLPPEVYPAASLHYRQQHVYFESNRVRQRLPSTSGWFHKTLNQGCDLIYHLTPSHLRAWVDQLLSKGLVGNDELWGPSQWERYYRLREDMVRGVCNGMKKAMDAPKVIQPSYEELKPSVADGWPRDTESIVATCGVELCLSLVAAMSAGSPCATDAIFDTLSNQFASQPLFSLSPETNKSRTQFPQEALDRICEMASKTTTPSSLRLLLTIALQRGSATECLVVLLMLLSAREMELKVAPLMNELAKLRASYHLPLLRFAIDNERVEVRAAIRRAPAAVWGSDQKSDKWVVHSMSSDGHCVYLSTAEGLIKMGCGKGGVPAEIIARNFTDFPGQSISVAYVAGTLYARPSAAYVAACKLPSGYDILVVNPDSLSVEGYISASGAGSIKTDDNRYTAMGLALDTTVPEAPSTEAGQEVLSPRKKGIESRILTDGVYLYLVSGHAQTICRDELGGLTYPPTYPQQCRSKQLSVTVTSYDPTNNMAPIRTVVLSGPLAENLLESTGRQRKVLQICKDTYVDFGPVSERLSSTIGHVTIEMWIRPGSPDESKNIYVHGDKANGGEVFVDIHSLDNGWYVKGGARVDARNGVRSCGAVASLPSRAWVHVALIFDGRWNLLINGIVSGMSRAEDPPVVVTRPTKKWVLGASYVGCIAELRVWKYARAPAVIKRDMNTSLVGNESGLVSYYPLDEGQGRVVYDWACGTLRQNGWISRKPSPVWRVVPDFPVVQNSQRLHAHADISPWQIFLPSIESSGMCTNGRELAVLIPDVEDAGAGQRHGLTMYFSLEDGSLIPRNDLVAPPVDGACHFDRWHNGVWYASITFQVLCWSPSECAVPPPRLDASYDQDKPTLTAWETAVRLADAMNDRACRHMDHEWPAVFRDLAIDPSVKMFFVIESLLQSQFKTISTGRRASIVEDDSIGVACLRLLSANFRVIKAAGIDPKVFDLRVTDKKTGFLLYNKLLSIIEAPDPSRVIDEACKAFRVGLQLFFKPEDLLDLLKDLLKKGAGVCSRVLDAVCGHMAGYKQAIGVLNTFDGKEEEVEEFFRLLLDASFGEVISVKDFSDGARREFPITDIVVTLQAAILGAAMKGKSPYFLLIYKLLLLHASNLKRLAEHFKDLDINTCLHALRWSASGKALGYLVISVPVIPQDEMGKYLAALKGIALTLEEVCKRFKEVKEVEDQWSANWNAQDLIRNGGEHGVSSWVYVMRLTVECVAARTAGKMIQGVPEVADDCINKWVDSPLFAGGLRDPTAGMRLCDEIVSGTGTGGELWTLLKSSGMTSNMAGRPAADANEIDLAMRYLFAVLVRDMQPKPTLKTDASGSLIITASLASRFSRTEALQGWLMHIRHEKVIPPVPSFDIPPPINPVSDSPASALDQVIDRCKFVLRFYKFPSPSDNRVVVKALISTNSIMKKGKSKSVGSSWRSMFHGWRAIKKQQRLLALNYKTDATDKSLETLLEFLSLKSVDTALMEKAVLARMEKGRVREEGLNYLREVITSKSRPVRMEALRVASEILSLEHYTNGIISSGPAISGAVQESVYTLLKVVLAPLAISAPPEDAMSQVQCNMVLKLLHCKWADVDFAFLRSVDLPKVLFGLFSLWNADGSERQETSQSPCGRANAVIASNLFSACSLKSAMALASHTHPGLGNANSQFLSQILECISTELKQSISVLQHHPPRPDASKHVEQVTFLLTTTGSILQGLAQVSLDGVLLADLLPLLTLCVLLPSQHVKLSRYAMMNLKCLLPHLSTEQAEQGMSLVPLTDTFLAPQPVPQPVGSGKATIDAPELGGWKVVQFMYEIIGGIQPETRDTVVASEALVLLRLLSTKRNWQASIVAWLKSVLSDLPPLEKGLNLKDKSLKAFAVAIDVLGGTPESLRTGVEAEYCPKGSQIRTPVVIISIHNDKAVVVGSDLGLSSEENEVDTNCLRLTEQKVSKVDAGVFSCFLSLAVQLAQTLLAAPSGVCSVLPQGFPSNLEHCVPFVYIVSKMLRCLVVHMQTPVCAKMILEQPILLTWLSALSRGSVLDPSDANVLESKSLYLHSLLDKMEPIPSTEVVHVPTMRTPSAETAPVPSAEDEKVLSARRQAAMELSQILRGFGLVLCMKALELSQDDKDKAAAVLMDGSEEIAAAVEAEAVNEERKKHEESQKRELRREQAWNPTPLRYAVAFGPYGTGTATITLPQALPQYFTMEIILRVSGEGMFKKHRLHPDITPILPLKILTVFPSLELTCGDGCLVLSCCGVTGTVPYKEGWVQVVAVVREGSVGIICDGEKIANGEGSCVGGQDRATLGPGLLEAASELHPSVTTEVACLRVWNTGLGAEDVENLSSMVCSGNTQSAPCQSSLMVSFTMSEGRGSSIASDIGESTGVLENVRWSCVSLPAMAPEDTSYTPDVLCTEENESDVPRTEWASTYQRASVERVSQACCHADVSLAVLYAREALSGICSVMLPEKRAELYQADVSQFFKYVTPVPLMLPSTLARMTKFTKATVSEEVVDHLKVVIQAWLNTSPSHADIGQFVQGCLALLEEPAEKFVFETPTHPYTPTDVILQTIDIPGVSSYHVSFDPRCRTLDYLYFFTDRTQKSQIAKFPDPQGQWGSIEINRRNSFSIKFSGDAGAPSCWGYLFTVSVKTPRFELACEMLLYLLSKDEVSESGICNSSFAGHLSAAMHRESGARRHCAAKVLSVLLGKRAACFERGDTPLTAPLISSLRNAVDRQIVRDRPTPGVGMLKGHARYLHIISELAVAGEIAEATWNKNCPFNVPDTSLQDAKRRCYLSPAIRPTLTDMPPSQASSLRCACETTIRGKHVLLSEGVWRTAQGTTGVMLGRWYYEVKILSPEPVYIGWACEAIDSICGECSRSWAFCGSRGYKWHAGERAIYPDHDQHTKWKGGDIVGVMIDLYTRTMVYSLNGKTLDAAFTNIPAVFYFPSVTVGSSSVEINFGERQFQHMPLDGYFPLHGDSGSLPGIPVAELLAFKSASDALCHGETLPAFFAGLEKEPPVNRATRDGPDIVELVPVDARPKIEGTNTVRSQANSCTVKGNARVSKSGKWYYEALLTSDGLMQLGWITDGYSPDPVRAKGIGDDARSWSYDGCRLLFRHRKEQAQVSGGRAWKEGDIVGCTLDLDAMAMRFTLNGDPLCAPGQSHDAFRGLISSEWYYPAASMDPDNGLSFNFGTAPFVYPPSDCTGVSTYWAVHSALRSPPKLSLPDAMPFKSTPRDDVAMISFVNTLCSVQKQSGARLRELLIATNTSQYGLGDHTVEELHGRVVLLRHFNHLFRLAYPYIDLSDATSKPAGILTEAALNAKPFIMTSTVIAILHYNVQHTNSLVEPVQPKVTLNRRRAQAHRGDPSLSPSGSASLFGQLHILLSAKHLSMFFTNRRFWIVSLQGEGAEDVGGPYRECLSEMCNELMSPSATPLFTMSPNAANNVGTHRDRLILNPEGASHQHMSMLNFLGRLMAACLRVGEPLPLYISPIVWKALAGEPLEIEDLRGVDKNAFTSLWYLKNSEELTEETFKSVYDGGFTTEKSNGQEIELVPGGANLSVEYRNRDIYVTLALRKRLMEAKNMIDALKTGFYEILPISLAHLCTGEVLESLVCGNPEWNVSDLRSSARYEGVSPDDRRCSFLWEVLTDFSECDRGLFLRFVSGRERVPVKLKILPLTVDNPDDHLPVASTCFFWISLPNYSSIEIMRQKLLYAIHHCTDIDTDYRVRGNVDENAPPTIGSVDPPDDDEFEDYTHLL